MTNLEEFDKYINNTQSMEYAGLNTVLPLWIGMFKNSYKTEFFSETDSSNQRKNLAFELNRCLEKIRLINLDEQEKYLQNYPTKIKFINNFDYNNQV